MNEKICSLCGLERIVEQVLISHDAESWEEEGWLKPHHTIEKVTYPNGSSETVVKAPMCPRCMSHIFSHMAKHKPKGALDGYVVGDDAPALEMLSAFEAALSDNIYEGDILELIENMTGKKARFEVELVLENKNDR
jgi:hypothetical protein